MFFAYRGFTADPTAPRSAYGRAHHRAIHLSIGPASRVNELLDILCVTSQSLNRVLRQLVDDRLVVKWVGRDDRRQRTYPTDAGRQLSRNAASMAAADARRLSNAADLEWRSMVSQGAGTDDRPGPARAVLQGGLENVRP